MSADTAVVGITAADIREVMLDLVTVEPDRVDARSVNEVRPRYLDLDGEPACLVAAILLRLDFDTDTLAQLDAEFPLGELFDNGVRICESRNPALKAIEDKAMALLAYLQDAQEAGQSWLDSFYYAFAKPSRLIPVRYVKDRRPWLF